MNANEFKNREKAILDRYKEKLGKPISYDGVVDPEFYFSEDTPFRLLFILQTPNWKDEEQKEDWEEFKDWIKRNPKATTWKPIAEWTKDIFQNFGRQNNKIKYDESWLFWLKFIAFININKCGIPANIRNDTHLADALSKCADELKEQMCLYHPDFIIGCGVRHELGKLFKDDIPEQTWRKTRTCYYWAKLPPRYGKDSTVISFFHPQVRLESEFLTCQLINTLREIIG